MINGFGNVGPSSKGRTVSDQFARPTDAELHAYKGDRLEAIRSCERRISKPVLREGIKASLRKSLMYQLLIKAADLCLAEAASLDRAAPERQQMLAFIEGQSKSYGGDAAANDRAVADFCQLVMCLNEFMFVD